MGDGAAWVLIGYLMGWPVGLLLYAVGLVVMDRWRLRREKATIPPVLGSPVGLALAAGRSITEMQKRRMAALRKARRGESDS